MEKGSLGLGVLAGFVATLILGYVLPLIEPSSGWWVASFIGGLISGFVAKSGAGKGALAGFIAVIISGIIMLILAVGGVIGIFGAFGLFIAIFGIVVVIFGGIIAAVGGAIGGSVRSRITKQ